MSRRYTALLTDKQLELLTWCEERIVTAPRIARELTEFERDWWGTPYPYYRVSPESVYARFCTLEARGLMARNPGWTWPTEWMVTDAGREAIELAENDTGQVLAPSA